MFIHERRVPEHRCVPDTVRAIVWKAPALTDLLLNGDVLSNRSILKAVSGNALVPCLLTREIIVYEVYRRLCGSYLDCKFLMSVIKVVKIIKFSQGGN